MNVALLQSSAWDRFAFDEFDEFDSSGEPMSGEPEFHHLSVMLAEVLEAFAVIPSGSVIDATCGGAGHSKAILESRNDLRVIGLDRDPNAVGVARERLAPFGSRAEVHYLRFDQLRSVVANEPITGVLFDLGVSSAQFDIGGRGFSYRFDAPLDMRMDTTVGMTAADVVNTLTPAELRHVISKYGDERFADRIARALVANRPVTTTAQLAEIVTAAIPAATRRTGGHPAKRTFQALRIEVNDELRVLGPAVDAAIDVLAPGGRVVVLSYHSGEDRIVKDRFRFAETGGCSCPSGLPCVCGALPRGRMVRRGVLRPTAAEMAANPRAASAVARVFEKTDPGAPVHSGNKVGIPGSAGSASLVRDPSYKRAAPASNPVLPASPASPASNKEIQ
jgi:16S rRNA (cytosine1402-N4)-methyltransferase